MPVMTSIDHSLQEARSWQQQGPPPQQQAHQPGKLQVCLHSPATKGVHVQLQEVCVNSADSNCLAA